MKNNFRRGDIWFFNPDPTLGREQKKSRPCLILSVDTFNNGPADLLIVLPMTAKKKGIPTHIEVKAEGLLQISYVMCDQIRSISKERLINATGQRIASVTKKTLEDIERCLTLLLGFNR